MLSLALITASAVAVPSQFILSSGDDCGTPANITGTGVFTFDNSSATTGAQGQAEPLCLALGSTAIDDDIWFEWVAPASGMCLFSLCYSSTFFDSKIAAYAGSGCPVAGSALGCNDDSPNCGAFSEVLFPVSAGSVYMLQLGCAPGTPGAPGTFTLDVFPSLPEDDCSTPTSWIGSGAFAFDTSGATTGTQGQSEPLCSFSGQTTISSDAWYIWTASSTGCVSLSLCGTGPAFDPKLAVYLGAGCPSAGAIACNDDYCFSEPQVSWVALAGQSYTIQLGSSPGHFGGTGTAYLQPSAFGVGPDECQGASVIAGVGQFLFDNSSATTGCVGQNESLCAAGWLPAIEQDVWFSWIAPSSGTGRVDTTGQTGVDTKIAVYAAGGCPAPGSALACVDDCCGGLQSTVTWPCTAGTNYMIQLGSSPGTWTGAGYFMLDVLPPPANDDCSAPIALGAAGPYLFDLWGATTGAQGQSEPACNFHGTTAIDNDVWYEWLAPLDGRAQLSLCAGVLYTDTKLAVYEGSGCPSGPALACNDDAPCGWSSEVCFPIQAGHSYTIQLGTFPGSAQGSGSFDIGLLAGLPSCAYDDGSVDSTLTFVGGGDMVWLNRFGSPGATTVLSSVDVLWGAAHFPGQAPGNGTPTDVFVYQDGASQDGDPSDATLLLQIPTTVSLVDSDTYVHFAFAPLTISGVFFAGTHLQHFGYSGLGPVEHAAPVDTDCATPGVSWLFGDESAPGAVANYASPGANTHPPETFDSAGVPGQALVRAGCSINPAIYVCEPGVAGVSACPCSNPPAGSGRGCNNASSTGGASITAFGSNALATPTLFFTTASENATVGSVLIQGTTLTTGATFGHGIRCAGGVIKRLYAKLAVGGSIAAPQLPGDVAIPVRSAALGDTIQAGQKRWYQVYYRDTTLLLPGCPLPANRFNATNAAEITWQP